MDGSPAGFRHQPYWLLVVAVVALGQAGLARELFGPGGTSDPRPIVSGRHPLHLYHGNLGAVTFRERFSTSCYDPAFQAGYPKTPVFDGGCRPAELFLLLAGPNRSPVVAYKLGLIWVCALAPVCFAAAARGGGVNPQGSVLAAVAGALLWWTPPLRSLLDAGSVEHLLAGLMGLVFIGGLIRYAARPGVTGWLMMSGSAILGWYAHPVVWLGLLPVLTAYYIAVAPRFGLAWHLGLVGVTIAGLGPNLWWLWDWGRFWWLRQPSVDELTPLPTWGRLLGPASEVVGLMGKPPVGWAIFAAGVFGLSAMMRAGHRIAAGTVLLTVIWTALVARLGATWYTMQVVHTDRVAPFIVGVMLTPAAFLVAGWWCRARAGTIAVLLAAAVPAGLAWGGPFADAGRAMLRLDLRPLPVGLTAEQQEFVKAIEKYTQPDARILIEDIDMQRPGWNWTALLPVMTGRPALGGIDPGACVEHAFCGLRHEMLNGRPFTDWTPSERTSFCQRYNVGWVLCRTPTAADFWRADPTAREVARFADRGEVILFALDRPRSYILAGTATVERMDRQKIVLTDACPDAQGNLVLSLHHQAGFRVAPSMVGVEPDKDPFDPIPMIKLRFPGPVSRITLTWENP